LFTPFKRQIKQRVLLEHKPFSLPAVLGIKTQI